MAAGAQQQRGCGKEQCLAHRPDEQLHGPTTTGMRPLAALQDTWVTQLLHTDESLVRSLLWLTELSNSGAVAGANGWPLPQVRRSSTPTATGRQRSQAGKPPGPPGSAAVLA